jgi:diadenosine tetraphosphate (Ap4A) HIT family hydrolase
MKMTSCVYCAAAAEDVVWANEHCRVVLISDTPFIGWCRVIWNDHKAELTDLSSQERAVLMSVTFAVESGLRALLSPDKMNVASLGTGLPHLHVHVIPRFSDDTHFPEPVWTAPLREQSQRSLPKNFVDKLHNLINAEVAPN